MKIILIICLVLFGYQYFSEKQKREQLSDQEVDSPTISQSINTFKTTTTKSNFSCDGRIHCSQMHSCEEATFFINNCPGTKMDGDNDGIPCEQQFC
ncbi:excalibur calcium-binding domain-containing protein [Methylotenera sp. N17]|uniref:excalibur calcium-binding domain-containing protein n=1 Tax=Methylotenera sp. N17 TaxID=1502761 RepID=UPI000649097E|nr:excalibur calcium-binding domain-containing protein [Methylotenera sp. N17]